MAGVNVNIRIEGLDKLQRELDPARVTTALGRVVKRVNHIVLTRMAVYPPEGPYNRPGPPGSRWYQRLKGPRWRRVDGSIGGRNTSQKLQPSWRQKVLSPLSREVFTEVTYSPFVVSKEEQTSVHAAHGWQTDEQVAEEVEADPIVERIIDSEIKRGLGV